MSAAVEEKLKEAGLRPYTSGGSIELRRGGELLFIVDTDIAFIANRKPTFAERIAAGFVYLQMIEDEMEAAGRG